MPRTFPAHVITDDSALGGSVIERSLRFNRNDNAYLSRTPSSAGNRKTWTFSTWVKLGQTGVNSSNDPGNGLFLSCGGAGTGLNMALRITNNGYIGIDYYGVGGYYSTGRLRDPSAWYHCVWVMDTTESTSDNRMKVYVNGNLFYNNSMSLSQNADTPINNNSLTTIGVYPYDTSHAYRLDAYLTEVHFVDGYAYDSSYFGHTESQTGLWRPKKYEGAYGTNGFHLDFSDNSSTTTLGIDKSPNGNDFTLNNFSVSAGAGNDSLEDTPTNNYPTLNLIFKNGSSYESNGTIENGVLAHSSVGSVTNAYANVTLPTVGQYYWEVRMSSINSASLGIMEAGGNINRSILYNNDGTISQDNASAQSGLGSWSGGDIIGIAYYGADTTLATHYAKIQFYRNGSAQGSALNLTTWTNPYIPFSRINAYADFNFGQRPFDYTPPIGFGKLSARDIIPTSPSIIRPQKHFETLLYTGTGSSNSVTGLEFAPDFIWARRRSSPDGHHFLLIDSVRGGSKSLQSNTNDSENSNANRDMTFLKDGIRWNSDTGNANASGESYVVWCWKGGGAAVSNTNGDITSSVSVNEEAGFSIVSYSGNGGNGQTVGHGLSKAPQWIMLKSRTAGSNWRVWSHALATDGSKRLILDQDNVSEDAGFLYDTAPSSTVFTLGNSDNAWNVNSGTYIAYCWHEVPGYSKFGKYDPNQSDDGPFVNLGFKPAWIMVKAMGQIYSGVNGNWYIIDSSRDASNPTSRTLAPNQDYDEDTGWPSSGLLDILSNGFKVRTSSLAFNSTTSSSFAYFAFAEQPGTTPFGTFANPR